MNSILIPGMSQDNYKALVETSAPHEGLVNGIWNSILHEIFKTSGGEWTINPEVHIEGGGYPDFLVLRNSFSAGILTWIILFEGKQKNGDTFEKILSQLVGYTKPTQNGQVTYLLAARGQKCGFWKYSKGNSQPDQQMSVDRSGVVVLKDLSAVQEYDIVDQQDQAKIKTMLEYIFTFPPAAPRSDINLFVNG